MKIRGDSSNNVPIKLQEALEYMPQAISYASGYQLGDGIHHIIVFDRIQGVGCEMRLRKSAMGFSKRHCKSQPVAC